MAAPLYRSFEDFQAHSGIQLPHSGNATTKRYAAYLNAPNPTKPSAPAQPQSYTTNVKKEKDGCWEYITPIVSASHAELPTTSGAPSSGGAAFRVSSVKSNRESNESAPGRGESSDSLLVAPTPPPAYAAFEEEGKDGKAFTLLGLAQLKPELTRACEQAQVVLHHKGHLVNSNGSIACPRAGCKHIADNAEAFARHLQIHIMAESPFKCARCKSGFEHSYALDAHHCRKRGLSMSAPIEALRRVLHID